MGKALNINERCDIVHIQGFTHDLPYHVLCTKPTELDTNSIGTCPGSKKYKQRELIMV